jgi:hypothetical protein
MDSAGFSIEDQPLPGVYVLNMPRFDDVWGIFLAKFHAKAFARLALRLSRRSSCLLSPIALSLDSGLTFFAS